MKKLLILAALISINAYAKDSIENSGSIHTEHVEEHGVKLPKDLKDLPATNSNTQTATTQSAANSSIGSHTGNVGASGNNAYTINNDRSEQTQTYHVDQYICIANDNCTHVGDTYMVSPHQRQTGNSTIYTTAYLPTPGTYEDESSIKVSGYESSSAKSVNKVTVY